MLLGLLPLLASCSSDGLGFDSAEQAGAGQVTFRFRLAGRCHCRGAHPQRTAGTDSPYVVCHSRRTGRSNQAVVSRNWKPISPKLTIEGLGYGDYTVVFLATTHPESDITVDEPALLSDAWLVNHVEGTALMRPGSDRRR